MSTCPPLSTQGGTCPSTHPPFRGWTGQSWTPNTDTNQRPSAARSGRARLPIRWNRRAHARRCGAWSRLLLAATGGRDQWVTSPRADLLFLLAAVTAHPTVGIGWLS